MKTWWPYTPKPENVGDFLTPWMMWKDGVAKLHLNIEGTEVEYVWDESGFVWARTQEGEVITELR